MVWFLLVLFEKFMGYVMALDFSVQNRFVQMQTDRAENAGSSESVGSLLGSQAQAVSSPMSLLADAAEELTFAADTTKEFELEERKDRDREDEAVRRRVELYKDLMHEAGKTKQLDVLKDSLQAKAGREHALREALSRFPDFTDAYAALQSVLEEWENDASVSSDVKDGIRGALEQLESEHWAEIKTGLHGALSRRGFEDLGTADDARDLYRQTVFDFESVGRVFSYVQEKFGSLGFDKAMDFLFAALSSDIASDNPSMEKSHLEYVHGNLGKIRLLQSAFVQCEALVNRLKNVHGVQASPLTSMDLLSSLTKLREINYLGAMHIEDIAKKAHAPDIEKEVLFLQDLMNMLRNLPVQFFDGEQGTQKVLDAAQQALDKAIEREDEYLAGLE